MVEKTKSKMSAEFGERLLEEKFSTEVSADLLS
jgi:hypothetical protein